MGTNYYRIPTVEEMESKKKVLIKQISDMDLTPSNIERGFRFEKEDSWDSESPWDVFLEDTNIHLGKRSGGWKFCWNFHNDKYYKNKEELLNFIRSGRVVDEYGDEQNVEEFITMALDWEQPDGWTTESYYRENPSHSSWDVTKYFDRFVDGLRISSSTEFS
jgi:hypothetical protein